MAIVNHNPCERHVATSFIASMESPPSRKKFSSAPIISLLIPKTSDQIALMANSS